MYVFVLRNNASNGVTFISIIYICLNFTLCVCYWLSANNKLLIRTSLFGYFYFCIVFFNTLTVCNQQLLKFMRAE